MTRISGPFPNDPHRPQWGGAQAPAPMTGMAGRPDPRLQYRSPEYPKKSARSRFRNVVWAAAIGFMVVGVAAAVFYVLSSGIINLPFLHNAELPLAANETVIFSGRAADLRQSRGNTIQQDPANSSVVWIKSSLSAARSSGATDGVSVRVPSALVAGARRIRVTVSARGVGIENQAPFAAAYSAGSAGNSGWLVFQPTNEFKDFSFNYTLPRGAASTDHYVGIWSDISGRNGPLGIRRITIAKLQ